MLPRATKLTVLTAFLACMLPARGGDLPPTAGAFYAISVSNLEDSIAWYKDNLGFSVVSRAKNEARAGAVLEKRGALLEIAEFSGAAPRHPGLESHQVYGIFKLGFTTASLDEAFEHLRARGVEIFFPIVKASDAHRTFGVKDNEGNIVQFFEVPPE